MGADTHGENTIIGRKKIHSDENNETKILGSLNVKTYDYINPQHYVGDDGKQTWERMVEIWGEEATALWCEMTAFKYSDTRIGKKPNEDTEREKKKIHWYLKKAHELRTQLKNK